MYSLKIHFENLIFENNQQTAKKQAKTPNMQRDTVKCFPFSELFYLREMLSPWVGTFLRAVVATCDLSITILIL